MKNKIVGICICMMMIVAVIVPAAGTINNRETGKPVLFNDNITMGFAPGELIVKLKKDITFSKSSLMVLNEKHQVYALEKVFPNAKNTILDNIYLLSVPRGSDILSIVQEYASCPDVMYAEPNGIAYLCGIPNDANFSNQWHLHNTGQIFLNFYGQNFSGTPDADIDAPEAWDITTGNSDVVIAIVDSGIDYTHPDLAANIWNNMDEIPGNGIDDDNNGYIDDVKGWDFCYNTNDPRDVLGHGTMCAGIAGAVTNNGIWGAGVARNCTIMPVRAFDENGNGLWNNISAGIKYAADNGADVLSMSFGGFGIATILQDAINYTYGKGIFLCAAAGNNNISRKFYPAAYENVAAVAATNHNDNRVTPEDFPGGWGSNYGDWVDIAAPGNIIYSTMPTYHVPFNDQGAQQNFSWGGGTSYATPQVAGVAALLLSKDPSLSPDEVKTLLCGNVDPYNATEYIGTGRLNAQKALIALQLKDGVKIKGGLGVKAIITNNGTSDANDVAWQIHVEGGILGRINKTMNGTTSILAGKSITVSIGMLLGLGSFNISAVVAGMENTAKGSQLFIFSVVK